MNTYDTVYTVVTWTAIVSITIGLGYSLFRWLYIEWRNHKSQKAPVQTCDAVVQCKHPEKVLVNQGRTSGDVHFITFRTSSGETPKLYMTFRDFYAMEEGAKGTLTWQGERFWKFIPEEAAEK